MSGQHHCRILSQYPVYKQLNLLVRLVIVLVKNVFLKKNSKRLDLNINIDEQLKLQLMSFLSGRATYDFSQWWSVIWCMLHPCHDGHVRVYKDVVSLLKASSACNDIMSCAFTCYFCSGSSVSLWPVPFMSSVLSWWVHLSCT